MAFSEHEHQSRFEQLLGEVRSEGKHPSVPPRIADLLTGESFIGACQGCRIVAHVIGHRAARP